MPMNELSQLTESIVWIATILIISRKFDENSNVSQLLLSATVASLFFSVYPLFTSNVINLKNREELIKDMIVFFVICKLIILCIASFHKYLLQNTSILFVIACTSIIVPMKIRKSLNMLEESHQDHLEDLYTPTFAPLLIPHLIIQILSKLSGYEFDFKKTQEK